MALTVRCVGSICIAVSYLFACSLTRARPHGCVRHVLALRLRYPVGAGRGNTAREGWDIPSCLAQLDNAPESAAVAILGALSVGWHRCSLVAADVPILRVALCRSAPSVLYRTPHSCTSHPRIRVHQQPCSTCATNPPAFWPIVRRVRRIHLRFGTSVYCYMGADMRIIDASH